MSASIARIHVNGIEVGSLPVETYNGIVSSVRKDRRLYVAYAFRAVGMIVRMLARATVAVPGFLLLAFAFLLIAEPASITALITSLRAAPPEEITAALTATVIATWVGAVIFVPMAMVLFSSGDIAFNSPFSDAVNRRVRSMLEVPTEGPVVVFIENPSTAE